MAGSLIHIKLDYDEAINAKRDLLSFERDLIRVLKRVKNYHNYRSEELKVRLRIYRRIKELKTSLNKLGNSLPKVKIPEILSKGREEFKIDKKIKTNSRDLNLDLDSQLEEIQNKLKKLQ